MLQSIINVGIRSDLLDIEVNPFTLVDFHAAQQEEDEKRAFELKSELPKLLAGQFGGVFRLLVGSSLRIGELANDIHAAAPTQLRNITGKLSNHTARRLRRRFLKQSTWMPDYIAQIKTWNTKTQSIEMDKVPMQLRLI